MWFEFDWVFVWFMFRGLRSKKPATCWEGARSKGQGVKGLPSSLSLEGLFKPCCRRGGPLPSDITIAFVRGRRRNTPFMGTQLNEPIKCLGPETFTSGTFTGKWPPNSAPGEQFPRAFLRHPAASSPPPTPPAGARAPGAGAEATRLGRWRPPRSSWAGAWRKARRRPVAARFGAAHAQPQNGGAAGDFDPPLPPNKKEKERRRKGGIMGKLLQLCENHAFLGVSKLGIPPNGFWFPFQTEPKRFPSEEKELNDNTYVRWCVSFILRLLTADYSKGLGMREPPLRGRPGGGSCKGLVWMPVLEIRKGRLLGCRFNATGF